MPVLILHARHDTLVPISNGERLARWSGGELVVFDRGDHNTILADNGPAILAAVERFATKAARRP
jgi:pimeloyl-ACP methyl ester carboxylesterase